MMAEAVAIVIAPRQTPNYGVFRLTTPPGLRTVNECPMRGFHPHPNDGSLYRSIDGSGHAQFGSALSLKTYDLR